MLPDHSVSKTHDCTNAIDHKSLSDREYARLTNPKGSAMSADGHDNWHQNSSDEGVPQEAHGAQASAKAMGLTIIAMTLGVLFVIIVLVVYFQNYMSNYKSMINENTEAAAISWHERQSTLDAMEAPMQEAMAVVIAEYAQD
tara:strand:- start:2103 stop:2528 length:426 start_codon:yes stop_codon:yes gene_type:complete